MSRRWAQLQTEDGSFTKISRKAAFEMVAGGDFEILRRRPLAITLCQAREFQEEQRHNSGRRIPGVTKPLFNGKSSISSGIRCRPPRSIVNWEFVRTSILVKEFRKDDEARRDQEVQRQERKARRRARKGKKKRRGQP